MSKLRFHPWLVAGVAALLVARPDGSWAQTGDDRVWESLLGPSRDLQGWPRHFRLGAAVGLNLQAQFSVGGTFDVSGNSPGPTGIAGANHRYDNGYVLVSATGNAEGRTWNWGYQSTNQIQGGQLVFDAVESYATTSSSAEESGGAQVGIDLAYGGHLQRWGSALVGWEFGFGWLPVNIKDSRQLSATVSRVTHSFDPGGIQIPGLLGSPGQGNFVYEGTFSGPGPSILDVATDGGSAIVTDVPLTSERTLDVNVFSLRLGPTLHWEIHRRFAVAVSAGAAVGIISGDLEYDDTMLVEGTTTSNRGQSSSTEIAYGGYVAGTLLYHAVKNGDLYLGVQYMPMTSTTFGSNGREAELDLSGALYISAGINWPF